MLPNAGEPQLKRYPASKMKKDPDESKHLKTTVHPANGKDLHDYYQPSFSIWGLNAGFWRGSPNITSPYHQGHSSRVRSY